MEKAVFGPAGSPASFYEMGYKGSLDIPEYIVRMGLDVFEYQCGRGVNIGEEKARELGKRAKEKGVALTLHSPYYISLSSSDEEKRLGSLRYIRESAQAVDWMGGSRVVVHSGAIMGRTRAEALELAKKTLGLACAELDESGLSHIVLCPETMGKINQLGDLDEVMELCLIDERLMPCIDFGHLNARTLGGISGEEDYRAILLTIRDRLGEYRFKNFHCHFSKIEYTNNGGEKRHLTFEDSIFGPAPEPFARLIAEYKLTPVVICESDSTQAEDALTLKRIYTEALR